PSEKGTNVVGGAKGRAEDRETLGFPQGQRNRHHAFLTGSKERDKQWALLLWAPRRLAERTLYCLTLRGEGLACFPFSEIRWQSPVRRSSDCGVLGHF